MAHPTTLDAQGQGRVLFITGPVSPTVEGLRVTGGNAAGLDGSLGWNAAAGGGVYIFTTAATISGNYVFSNTAEVGGGLYLHVSAATLDQNTILSNTATGWDGAGGGVFLCAGSDTLRSNDITSNTAGRGGGLASHFSRAASLERNSIKANTARYGGGGLTIVGGDAILVGNVVYTNSASAGGGLYLLGSDVTLLNNVVADNWAGSSSGLYVEDSFLRLLHTTIARNGGGDGDGISVHYESSTLVLTDTILAGHKVGINVVGYRNTASLEATLWGSGVWANEVDWAGAGTIVTGTVNLWGDPAFVDPDAGDYHLGPGSAAIDAGVATTVAVDIDGEPRPMGDGVDIGADELLITLEIYLPLVTKTY